MILIENGVPASYVMNTTVAMIYDVPGIEIIHVTWLRNLGTTLPACIFWDSGVVDRKSTKKTHQESFPV